MSSQARFCLLQDLFFRHNLLDYLHWLESLKKFWFSSRCTFSRLHMGKNHLNDINRIPPLLQVDFDNWKVYSFHRIYGVNCVGWHPWRNTERHRDAFFSRSHLSFKNIIRSRILLSHLPSFRIIYRLSYPSRALRKFSKPTARHRPRIIFTESFGVPRHTRASKITCLRRQQQQIFSDADIAPTITALCLCTCCAAAAITCAGKIFRSRKGIASLPKFPSRPSSCINLL